MTQTRFDSSAPTLDEVDAPPRWTTLVNAFDDPLIGWKVKGRYLIERVLADGGMGRVYLASDAEHGKVAIKTLLAHYAADEEFVERFMREVRTLEDAQCPHVVPMYDHGALDDGRHFFAMKYIEGISLDEALRELDGRTMHTKRALRIALQLCAALVPAHELGIVHRDIKPDNLMLSEIDGEKDVLTVLDFGLAKPSMARQGITRAGDLLGTPIYMSPEQCEGKPLDDRSDIYSLGVLLYELLCGEAPFEYEEPRRILHAHVKEEVVPPSRRDPKVDIPMPLEWMLLCCLHKDPDRRFQTMREVHEEMGHIATALGVRLPVITR